MLKMPILFVLFALAAGICVGDVVQIPTTLVMFALLFFLAMLLRSVRRQRGVIVAAWLVIFLIGILRSHQTSIPIEQQPPCGNEGLFLARVQQPLQRLTEHRDTLRRRVLLTVVAEQCENQWQPFSGKVFANLWDEPRVVRGDLIETRMAFHPHRQARNPTEKDPLVEARHEQLIGRVTVLTPHAVIEPSKHFLRWLDAWRDQISEIIEQRFTADVRGVVKALATGDYGSLKLDLRDAWSDAGITHLLSISGLHVSFIGLALFFLWLTVLRFVRPPWQHFRIHRFAAALTILPLALYCVWSGASAPALRATIMATSALLALVVAQPNSALNALGVAGTFLLFVDPTSLYDPSFLLSFGGMLALLSLPNAPTDTGLWNKTSRYFKLALVASIAASAATLPIVAYYFGRISIIAPIANLIAVPLGSVVLTPLALLFSIFHFGILGDLFAWLVNLSTEALNEVAYFFAALPWAAIDVPRPNWFEILSYVGLLISLFLWRTYRSARAVTTICFLSLLGCFSHRIYERHFGDGQLHMIVPYVGQGDSTLVIFPNGSTMLVDAGGSIDTDDWDPGRSIVAPLLRQHGIRSLDLAIISHPHPDHLNGMEYIAKHFPIRKLWWNGQAETLPTLQTIFQWVKKSGGQSAVAASLPSHHVLDNVDLTIFHPRPTRDTEELPYYPEFNTNDNSIVIHASWKNRSVLLTGDIETSAEHLLEQRFPAVDILKVPHHGSRTSSTDALLHTTRAKLATISCGENNRFKFPHPTVLEAYKKNSTQVLRTDNDGLIHLWTDGGRWSFTTFGSHKRGFIP